MAPLPSSSAAGSRNLGLDLVRATAILSVIIGHLGPRLFSALGLPEFAHLTWPAAFFGVELFFVLSGFLIGRILFDIAAKAPTGGALMVFLTRRWMRTLPLYFMWIVLLWAFLPYDQGSWREVLRYLTLTQNFYRPMPNNNWFPVSWSLSVEEWFYLLFGSSVILCAAWLPRRLSIWLPIAIFISVPTIVRIIMPVADPLFLDMRRVALLRLDAIAYGAILAAISMYRPGWLKRTWTLLSIGLVLVVAAWENVAGLLVPWHMAGGLMLTLSSLGLGLCLPAAVRLQRAAPWFETTTRTISAQSYGLYIMHLTFLDLAYWVCGRLPWANLSIALLVSLALSFLLSWLSFHYFETPILNLRPSQSRALRLGGHPVLVSDVAPRSS